MPIPHMMDSSSNPPPRTNQNDNTNGYADVICLTIVVYDLMLTLPLEVALIWHSKWSVTKSLYLYSRYFPVFVFTFYLLYDAPAGPLSEIAGSTGLSPKLSDWLLNVNLVAVEALFSLRTWAIWNRKRPIGILLLILFCSLWTTTFVLLILVQINQVDTRMFGFINFGMLAGFYFCTSALMCIRAYQSYQLPGTTFMRTIHLHGVLYYIFLFVLSLASLIISVAHRHELGQVLPRTLQLFFTIMVTRMTLNLRETGNRTMRNVNTDNTEFTMGVVSLTTTRSRHYR